MQGSSAPTHVRLLLPLLVLSLLSAPTALSQLPDTDSSTEYYDANIVPQRSSVSVEYLGTATVPVVIQDISQNTGEVMDTPRERNRIQLSVDIVGNNTQGWVASVSKLSFPTEPGETHELTLNIQAGATVVEPTVEVRMTMVYSPISGEEKVRNASVLAVAETFPRLSIQMGGLPDTFEPDESQRVPIEVTNNNYYPDMVSLRVTGPEGWLVSPPSSVRLGPGETKTVYIDVKAPENPWFRYTTQSELISVDAVSETSGQPLVTVGVPITTSGSNFPAWAGPHLLMLLLGAGVIAKRSRRAFKERGLRKGKPSYPGLAPEHEAELEALKIEDPEEAEAVEERLGILYDQRTRAWKEAYKERKEERETLQEAYAERHDALVEAREQDGETDPEVLRRRRELLQRKRELLEEKRERLANDEPDGDDGPGGST